MSFLSRIVSRFSGSDPAPHKRRIEAGAGGPRTDGWAAITAPQTALATARAPAMQRAAAAYLNTPQGARIVETWLAALWGRGWQIRPNNPEFEALLWSIAIPAIRALIRDGEAFVWLRTNAQGALAPKLIPASQVDPTLNRDLGNGLRIVAGIEITADDKVNAYHVLREAPDTPFGAFSIDAQRVPAEDMIHAFDKLFPGQTRGLTWLAPVLLKMRDRDEASDALLVQLKLAGLLTGFIESLDGGTGGFEGETDANAINVALEPGAMRILPEGTRVSFSKPGDGLQQSAEFLRAQDREIAAGVGLTFEQLTGDLGEANYSSARSGLLEFRRRAEMLQKSIIENQFLRPLWQRFAALQALAGTPAGEEGRFLISTRFVAPGWSWVDPRNEVEAEVAAINAGLKSRAEVVAGRGRDIDEVDEEIARDRARENGGTSQ